MVLRSGSELDRLGRLLGSSRSSLYRNLFRRYEPFLARFREDEFDLLEIGVGDGSSLRVWLDYFPKARVVGLDVRRLALQDLPERCRIIHGSQGDAELLAGLVRDYRFRVVVDDGSRIGAQQYAAFAALFPALEPGGIYVAEAVYDPSFPTLDGQSRDANSPDGSDNRAGRADRGTSWQLTPRSAETASLRTEQHEPDLLEFLINLGRHQATGGHVRNSDDQPLFASAARRVDMVAFLPLSVVVVAKGPR